MEKLTAAQLQEITKQATANDPILVGDNGLVLKKSPFTAKVARSYEVNHGVKFTEYPTPAVEETKDEITEEITEETPVIELAPAVEETTSPNPPAPTEAPKAATKAAPKPKKSTSKTTTK